MEIIKWIQKIKRKAFLLLVLLSKSFSIWSYWGAYINISQNKIIPHKYLKIKKVPIFFMLLFYYKFKIILILPPFGYLNQVVYYFLCPCFSHLEFHKFHSIFSVLPYYYHLKFDKFCPKPFFHWILFC